MTFFVKTYLFILKTTGHIIKELRTKKKLLLREVAASIKIDSAILSKYEKGSRLPTQEHINKLANYYNISEKKLLTIWLSDRIIKELNTHGDIAMNVLKASERKIKYLK